jgi:SAM-dependent methyltransferase
MTPDTPLYDDIGKVYGAIRRADPRLEAQIWEALGDARTVVNVGAGAGSYEPPNRDVVAVEPSAVMIAQRPPGSSRVVQGDAEHLPFEDNSFDAAMAVITVHHWTHVRAGIAEMLRVSRERVIVVCFDYEQMADYWVVRDYLPEAPTLTDCYPSVPELLGLLPGSTVDVVAVPSDCTDRMFVALWARPELHLDPDVRSATSVWHQVPPSAAERAIEQLRRDLASGEWDRRYGHLRRTRELDVGLRLIRLELRSTRGARAEPLKNRLPARDP